MYTPAATIVAAWMSAETGVGPSIASGSQTCNGTCALLPTAPQKISAPINVNVAAHDLRNHCRQSSPANPLKLNVPVIRPQQQDAEHHAEVADAVDEERFLPGFGGAGFLEPEADEQIAAERRPVPRR